jgi:hypothetical protein
MSSPEPRPRVTVEDLLRLKRAERPSAEFWPHFEAELRQKQLAALVQHRRWWERMPQLFASRAYFPIGAAAVLTVTFISVRDHAPVAPPEVAAEMRIARSAAPAVESAQSSFVAAVESAAPAVPEAELRESPESAASAVRLSDSLPPSAGELVPWGTARADMSPSARSIAANLARLEQTEPELANALLDPRLSEGRSVSEQAASVAELAALSAVASRRNRVLAQVGGRQFAPEPTAPEVVRERHVRRLGDVELTGGWTRVGVKADRVSLKF